MKIENVKLVPAPCYLARGGLIAWATVTVGCIRLSGIAIRTTLDGRVVISYPTRYARSGRQHPIALPVDAEVRRELEARLIAEAERRGLLGKGHDARAQLQGRRHDQRQARGRPSSVASSPARSRSHHRERMAPSRRTDVQEANW